MRDSAGLQCSAKAEMPRPESGNWDCREKAQKAQEMNHAMG
jgi:hypothetical protein